MGKLIFIHTDTAPYSWGNGTALSYNDNPFKPHINWHWNSNASGNIENNSTGGVQITYQANGFATPKPVRIVKDKGNTSYLNLNSIYGAVTSLNNSSVPSVVSGELNVDIDNSPQTGMFCFFGWLDEIPKKTDGTNATIDSEAVYYELVFLTKSINSVDDVVGFGYKAVTPPSNFIYNTTRFISQAMAVSLDGATLSITNGIASNTNSVAQIGFSGSYDSLALDICAFSQIQANKESLAQLDYANLKPGDAINWNTSDFVSWEVTKQGFFIANRSRDKVEGLRKNIFNNSEVRIAIGIAFYVNYGQYFGNKYDDLSIIGFDDIINA